MLIKKNAQVRRIKQLSAGGRGKLIGHYAVEKETTPEGNIFAMAGIVTLAPGDILGAHTHSDDGEVYLVLSGHGRYTENGQTFDIGPGDMTVTEKGGCHGMENTGDEPLVWAAVIARSH